MHIVKPHLQYVAACTSAGLDLFQLPNERNWQWILMCRRINYFNVNDNFYATTAHTHACIHTHTHTHLYSYHIEALNPNFAAISSSF